MKNLFKGKIATIIILLATFILAGVAVFTAIRLYQLRQVPVAPNVPESRPQAAATEAPIACSLTFSIATPSPSPTPTPPSPTPTRSPSPTPTRSPVVTATPSPIPTQVPQCNNNCTNNTECPSDLICHITSGATTGNCRRESCLSETDCTCPVATPTPVITPVSSPTTTPTLAPNATPGPTQAPTIVPTPVPTQPALPQSGTSWTTLFGVGIGIITIIGALVLAL